MVVVVVVVVVGSGVGGKLLNTVSKENSYSSGGSGGVGGEYSGVVWCVWMSGDKWK